MGNRLSKIYTRTGDDGSTGLGDGTRVAKDSARVTAYGTVDEANSARSAWCWRPTVPDDVREALTPVQHQLFDLGGELCIPGHGDDRRRRHRPARTHASTRFNADLPPLKDFILPGGGMAAARCHLARTIVPPRRARSGDAVARVEAVRPQAMRYLNRLSDLLFVLARVLARASGHGEVLWKHERRRKPQLPDKPPHAAAVHPSRPACSTTPARAMPNARRACARCSRRWITTASPALRPASRRRAPRASSCCACTAPPTVDARAGQRHSAGAAYRLDADTVMSPGSAEAALRAAGAAVAAVDACWPAQRQRAFCAVRPPGHHATREQAMGFCLFNNVAVAAAHALAAHGLERVAIVDFDVHHGNGTQDIFERDPRVLFVSSRTSRRCIRAPGASDEPASATSSTAPCRPAPAAHEFRDCGTACCCPRLHAFKPQLVLVSAGFDAHRDDPLADIRLGQEDYAWITERLVALAGTHAGGRLVSTLEGGYDLAALAASTAAHVNSLMA